MRPDMKKVIVDTVRVYARENQDSHYNRNLNRNLKPHLLEVVDTDEGEVSVDIPDSWHSSGVQGMRPRCSYRHDRKGFGDRLNPIHRFLKQRCGSNWDDVYSEISRDTDMRSLMGEHLRFHIKWIVEEHASFDTETETWTSHNGYSIAWFFVHPDTGILMDASKRRKRRKHTYEINVVPVKNKPTQFFVRRPSDNLWFKLTLDIQEVISERRYKIAQTTYLSFEYSFKQVEPPEGLARYPHIPGYFLRKVKSASKKDLKYIRKVVSESQ